MSHKEWSVSRVRDVKETKNQGRVERKFLIEWEAHYSTAKDVYKTENELYNMYTKIRVLGPAKIPANNKLTDPSKMIWAIEEAQVKSENITVRLVPFQELKENYSRELVDYFLPSVQIVQK